MKRLILIFFFLIVTSCYKETNEFPYPEYLGNWNNEKTTINGIPDDIYPNNKVPHYVFQIAQSEVTLPYDRTLGSKYQMWELDKTTTPYKLLLYRETTKEPPTIIFLITKEPTMGKMEITYQDSIIYYLLK